MFDVLTRRSGERESLKIKGLETGVVPFFSERWVQNHRSALLHGSGENCVAEVQVALRAETLLGCLGQCYVDHTSAKIDSPKFHASRRTPVLLVLL